MAAVPFGFSFGDFIAAIEVIHKVAQALRKSSGARSHFHQTVADLESFETVLRRVEALSPTTSSPDAVEAIRLCAFKCHPPLNHFLQRIHFYEKHMGQPSGSKTQLVKSVTGGYWKAKWAIKVEQEVAKLKADIGPLLEAISVLLQIESREQGAATHDAVKGLVNDVTSGFDRIMLAVQEQALANRHIDLRITDMQLDAETVVQQLPQLPTSARLDALMSMTESVSAEIGSTATKDQISHLTGTTKANQPTADSRIHLSYVYRLLVSAVMALVLMLPNFQSQLRTFMTLLKSPSLLLSNSIMVTDALNRTKLLPYEYFCNWTLVQPWLESAFKDLPGESRVRRGDYAMFVPMRDGTTPVLSGEHWKRSVFPGNRVVMSMLSTMTSWNKCTRCGHAMPTQVVPRDWIECTECGRLQNLVQSQSTPNARQESSAPMPIVPPEHQFQQEKERNEDDKFTRVHMYIGGLSTPDLERVTIHGETPLHLVAAAAPKWLNSLLEGGGRGILQGYSPTRIRHRQQQRK